MGWKSRFGKWMKKIGLVGEKIRGQKINVKSSGWKINGKNWTRQWKNSNLENWHEKNENFFKIFRKYSSIFSKLSKIFQKSWLFSPNYSSLSESFDIMKHTDTFLLTNELDNLSLGSVSMTQPEFPSCIVSKYPRDSRIPDFSFTEWV